MRRCLLIAPLLLASCANLNSQPSFESDAPPTNGGNPVKPVPGPVTGQPNSTLSGSPNNIPVTDPSAPTSGPTVRFLGRFDTTDPNHVVFSWSGSTITTRFHGTSLTIGMVENENATYGGVAVDNFYDVFIDGALSTSFQAVHGSDQYALTPANLADGNHTVSVVKRTEAQIGSAVFTGFTTNTGGHLLPAPLPKTRRIEFIGDSITAGFGDEAESNYPNICQFTPATENADITYAWDTGVALGADIVDIAFSGKGIVQNIDPVGDPYFTMPVIYPDINPPDSSVLWDFNSWVPDVVVVNLGTNDYFGLNTNTTDPRLAPPTDATFTAGYQTFIQQVRSHYPNATIVCALGPMLYGQALTLASNNIQAAVNNINAQGDTKVHFLLFPPDQSPKPAGYGQNFGCNYHPDITTHRAMAQILTGYIQNTMNW